MQPSVGRVVHYVSYGTPGGEYKPACRAAIITEAWAPGAFAPGSAEEHRATEVGLCVLNPTGQFFNREIKYDPGTDVGETSGPLCGGRVYHGGSWHWPERA